MPRIPLRPTIRSYNLFGEVCDLPDVVHCETIAARAVLHDREFAPHRHARLHQVLLIARGRGRAMLEGRAHQLRPISAANVPAGRVHGFTFQPGTQGWVVTLATEILDEELTPQEGLGRFLSEAAVFRGPPQMRMLMQDIFVECGARHFARAHVLKALSALLLGYVARVLAAKKAPGGNVGEPDLVRKFETLLDANFLAQLAGRALRRRAQDYAHTPHPANARSPAARPRT